MHAVGNAVIKSEDRSAAHKMRREAVFKLSLDGFLALDKRVLVNSALERELVAVLFAKLDYIVAAHGFDGVDAVDAALDKIVKYG